MMKERQSERQSEIKIKREGYRQPERHTDKNKDREKERLNKYMYIMKVITNVVKLIRLGKKLKEETETLPELYRVKERL